jgi:hypothetical protein
MRSSIMLSRIIFKAEPGRLARVLTAIASALEEETGAGRR